jgi:acyl-CoA oxidase
VPRVAAGAGAAGVRRRGVPGGDDAAPDVGAFLAKFETLAFGDLSLLVKFGVQFGLFGGSIFHLGSEEHRELLADVASLRLVGCFAMSETGHGSNVADIETTARYDAATGEFVIHTPRESARKDWIGGAATYARMATVFAQLEVAGEVHGVHAFLVNIRDESGGHAAGGAGGGFGAQDGAQRGRQRAAVVRPGAGAAVGDAGSVRPRDGGGQVRERDPEPVAAVLHDAGTLVAGRVSIASAAVSVAKVGLTVAIRYAAVRRQFGPAGGPETTILDYPAHQRRLLPALATTYALHFAVAALQARYVAGGEDEREVEVMAAGLKSYASWHATRTLQDCRECCGGQGYLSINRIAVLKDDADVFTTFEGDNTVLMQLVAKGLLTAFKQQFAGGRFTGMLRHVARRAATAVLEKNPIVTRLTDADHLRDGEFHAAAFRYREGRLLQTAAQRMRKRLSAGIDGQRAATEVQEHLLALAHAHVERVVFDAFAAGRAWRAPTSGCGRGSGGCATCTRCRGWRRTWHGSSRMDTWSRGRRRAIRREVEQLSAEVRAAAVGAGRWVRDPGRLSGRADRVRRGVDLSGL